jgi:DNA-binding transcriptional MocR family regulator
MLIDPGDAVIIDRPGYLGAIGSFRSAGARLAGWDIQRADLDELEELMPRYRPKLMYLNPTHQNPTSFTLPIRARRELIELAERYRVPIIEDDTYRELSLSTPPPPSLYELDEMNAVVIHLNSFAKMLAPGLRLGWISAVPAIVEQLALLKQRVDPHTQNLSQLAVTELIESGAFDRHIGQLRGEHRRRRDAMVKALRQHVPVQKLRFGSGAGSTRGVTCRSTRAKDAPGGFSDRVVGPARRLRGSRSHELRICYTAQPPERAPQAARALARAIAAVERKGEAEPALVSMA